MAVWWIVFFRLPYTEVTKWLSKNTRQNNPNNLIVLVMALSDLKSLVEWKELCVRYRYDITRFSIEALGMTPTWQQELLFRSIARDGSRTSVASGHGCFGIDTPIMLSDGTVKPVQNITLNDMIMGDDGVSERNVLDLVQGKENLYRFTYSDGTSHVFNESHILCLVATNSKGKKRKSGDKTTITVREWLAWSDDDKRCHAIYRSPVTDFVGHEEDLPIPPYILGVWLGDGTAKQAEITNPDSEIIKAWKKYAYSLGLSVTEKITSTSKSGEHCYRLNVVGNGKAGNNLFLEKLKNLDLINNKHIPQIYLTASIDDRKQLLAGLIDTDGSLDKAGYDFAQKNKKIAHQVVWLARSIGCHATVREVTKKCCNNGVSGQYWRVTIGRNVCNIPVKVERKKSGFNPNGRNNLHFSIKSVEPLGLGDYYGFTLDGNHKFLGGDFTVLSNTGKSRSAGVVALWHLLFHEDSITLFTAPSITQLREIVWKEISICLNLLRTHNLGWLADYVAIFAEKIYIKGYDKSWHVIAKTASKHKPESIAGQHGDNYLLWGDEASGIDDKIYDVALGALSHKDNRCVLTSQPTRNAGFFYETHHRLSHRNGGAWTSLTFNGEQSPIVSDEMLLEMLEKYGSRDDAGYMIRVRGLFPDLSNEFLVTRTQLDECYVGDSLLTGQHDDFGYVITVDVGGGVGRDDSTIAVSKVWGYANHGTDARRAEVIDIPLCKNKDTVHEIMGIIDECLVTYPNATLVVDDNGAGLLLGQELRARGMFYKSAKWGGQCFSNENRKDYFNKRSQANVCLSRAIAQGRFKIKTTKHKTKIQEQVTRIPYTFDEHARFKVLSKEEMLRRSIRSPDIADVFAYLFLEGVAYSEAYSDGFMVQDSDMQDNWQMLEQQAQEL